ncbi:hypothetical protein G7043_47140 [Lentzea sp. NEAU-D13]|uniref:Uncharacterized protein n=1 Tax=Lentzea alba TaxID=2714351 RepID=A0A7C9S321_9PSEU|nr:hypothetical protein [Lentzea alba]NGY66482.1 hypothetical protein [Lentzea alba]
MEKGQPSAQGSVPHATASQRIVEPLIGTPIHDQIATRLGIPHRLTATARPDLPPRDEAYADQ